MSPVRRRPQHVSQACFAAYRRVVRQSQPQVGFASLTEAREWAHGVQLRALRERHRCAPSPVSPLLHNRCDGVARAQAASLDGPGHYTIKNNSYRRPVSIPRPCGRNARYMVLFPLCHKTETESNATNAPYILDSFKLRQEATDTTHDGAMINTCNKKKDYD